MRRHLLNTNIAMESYGSRVALENISMEEEAVMVDEATTAAAEADQDLSEAERIIEVSDALEDLAVVADGIEEATPAETALVEIAGDMAVAGTDVAPEEIVPAMESYRGGRIATEGIRETARNIWESIRRYLKEVWEKIEKFFYNILGTIPRLRKSLDALEKHGEDVQGKHVENNAKVKMTAGLANISANHVPAKSEGDFSKNLSNLGAAVKFVYGNYAESVTKQGEAIADVIGDFDHAKPTEATAALRTKLKSHKPALPPGESRNTTRFPGFAAHVGEALPGNMSVITKRYVDNESDESDLGALDRYRLSRTDLMPTAEKAPTKHTTEVEFAPLSVSAAHKLIKEMRDILDTLEEYKRGSKSKNLAKAKTSLEKASEKANKNMGDTKPDDEGGKVAVACFRKILDFNAAYARWAQSPAVPMMSHALNVIKTHMVVIQKSFALYKTA